VKQKENIRIYRYKKGREICVIGISYLHKRERKKERGRAAKRDNFTNAKEIL